MDQQSNHSTAPRDYRCIDAKCHSIQQQHDEVNGDFQVVSIKVSYNQTFLIDQ